MPPDQPPRDGDLDPETRAVIDRAERAWRRQVELEERRYGAPDRMTAFRWIMVAIAVVSVVLLLLLDRQG